MTVFFCAICYDAAMEKPVMYGKFHLGFLISDLILSWLLTEKLKKCHQKTRIMTLGIIGIILIFLEIYKQYYLTYRINLGVYDWFHFPFQLCSVPMYLCALLPHARKQRSAIEAFLSTFTLTSAIFALAYPQDMLNSDLFLLLHSFLYHGILLFISLWIIKSRTFTWPDFTGAVKIFLCCAVTAEIINTIGYVLKGNPDMFYISPFMPASQPFFKTVAFYDGRLFEIMLYLISIILLNALLFYIMQKVNYDRIHSKR